MIRTKEESLSICTRAAAQQAPYHPSYRVAEFHAMFKHPIEVTSVIPTKQHRKLRVALIAEELKELAEASGVNFTFTIGDEVSDVVDPVEAADALADLDYVVGGSWLVWGFHGYSCFLHAHHSNMSKLGEDGLPVRRDDGKILKGPNYWKPDYASLLGIKPGDKLIWREYGEFRPVLEHKSVPA